ncbi:MAG: hypothetical protein JKX76_02485 [Colwellia sp.]|nr:hypothetical protein [Colwellia sp.]
MPQKKSSYKSIDSKSNGSYSESTQESAYRKDKPVETKILIENPNSKQLGLPDDDETQEQSQEIRDMITNMKKRKSENTSIKNTGQPHIDLSERDDSLLSEEELAMKNAREAIMFLDKKMLETPEQKDEGVEETKGEDNTPSPDKKFSYEPTEEELAMIAARDGINFLDEEMKKEPDTLNDEVVMPMTADMIVDDELDDIYGDVVEDTLATATGSDNSGKLLDSSDRPKVEQTTDGADELIANLEKETDDIVDDIVPEKEYITEIDRVFDENNSPEDRMETLKNLSNDDKSECIHNLCLITDVYKNKLFVIDIINNAVLNMDENIVIITFLLEESVKIDLIEHNEDELKTYHNDKLIWKALINLYTRNKKTISAMYHMRIATWLYTNIKYAHIGLLILNDFFNRTDIDDREVKYRNVLTLKNKVSPEKFEVVCLKFFANKNIGIRAKILSAQHIMQGSSSDTNECQMHDDILNKTSIRRVERILIPIMENENELHEVRADIADLLMTCGTEETKEKASESIERLGGNSFNVYENKENVHNKKVTESALVIINELVKDLLHIESIPAEGDAEYESYIEFIREIKATKSVDVLRKKFNVETISLLDLVDEPLIETGAGDEEHESETTSSKDAVKMALLRIELDHINYTRHRLTLEGVLSLVLKYLDQTFDEDHEIYERIEEELIESHGQDGNCSSGHAFRIVNILSGYTEYSVQVGFLDQMMNYFYIDFMKRLGDGDLRDIIIEEISENNFTKKVETGKFVRENMSSMREALYEVFKDDISNEEFDENFRKIMIKYEVLI